MTGNGTPAERGCALVTGGSRGIGAAVALGLAAAGWPVAVNYRADRAGAHGVVAEIERSGGRALAVHGDVGETSDVDALFVAAEAELGGVAVLVNNAGTRSDDLAVSMAHEAWDAVLRTNLRGPFNTCRRALPGMVRRRWGRIVNVSSAASARALPGQANYTAAKAGLEGLTRSLATEVARRGITANAIAPGLIETELTKDLAADRDWLRLVPARRTGTTDEVAACVRFLAGDAAAYVNGTTIFVDGGLSAAGVPIPAAAAGRRSPESAMRGDENRR